MNTTKGPSSSRKDILSHPVVISDSESDLSDSPRAVLTKEALQAASPASNNQTVPQNRLSNPAVMSDRTNTLKQGSHFNPNDVYAARLAEKCPENVIDALHLIDANANRFGAMWLEATKFAALNKVNHRAILNTAQRVRNGSLFGPDWQNPLEDKTDNSQKPPNVHVKLEKGSDEETVSRSKPWSFNQQSGLWETPKNTKSKMQRERSLPPLPGRKTLLGNGMLVKDCKTNNRNGLKYASA